MCIALAAISRGNWAPWRLGRGNWAPCRLRQGRYVVIDELDARLIGLLSAEPRIGVLEASRRLGVARGTVQARLDRLHARGIITGYGPAIDPAALGHAGAAFGTLEVQPAAAADPLARHLSRAPHDP